MVADLFTELEKKLDRQIVAEDSEDEPEPDEETNPVGALKAEIAKVQAKLDKQEKEKETEKRIYEARMAIDSVNQRLLEVEQQDPVFVMAENHIGKVLQRSMAREFPNASEEERKQEGGLPSGPAGRSRRPRDPPRA